MPAHRPARTDFCAFATAGLAIALGFAVLAGWPLRMPALVQLLPVLLPTQYNTALAFVLAGGLMLTVRRRQTTFAALGASTTCGITAVVSAMTSLKHMARRGDLHEAATNSPKPGTAWPWANFPTS